MSYYRRVDGTEIKEVYCTIYSPRPMNFLHAKTVVHFFGPTALKAVRELLIRGDAHPKHGP